VIRRPIQHDLVGALKRLLAVVGCQPADEDPVVAPQVLPADCRDRPWAFVHLQGGRLLADNGRLTPDCSHLHFGATGAKMAPCPVCKSKTFLKIPTESCGSELRVRISPYRNTFEAV
jgi:hypothetical protein